MSANPLTTVVAGAFVAISIDGMITQLAWDAYIKIRPILSFGLAANVDEFRATKKETTTRG